MEDFQEDGQLTYGVGPNVKKHSPVKRVKRAHRHDKSSKLSLRAWARKENSADVKAWFAGKKATQKSQPKDHVSKEKKSK